MHCRDLKYVPDLFRAYVTEAKLMETFRLAEEQGINVVFETGEEQVRKYNKEFGGHMQIIPSIHPDVNQNDAVIKDEIKRKVDAGIPAMYVWGVRSDELVRAGRVDMIAKAVEFAKVHSLPVGVGGHDVAGRPGLREGQGSLRLLREDLPYAPTIRRRRSQLRQHLVHQPQGNRRVHADGSQALDCLQGAGGGGDLSAAGVRPRLPQRRRFHRRGDVRLPDQGQLRIGPAHREGGEEAGPAMVRMTPF